MQSVLILGATGQVGIEVTKAFQSEKTWRVLTPKSNTLDLTNLDLISYVNQAKTGPFGLDIIVNCAAYTNVNGAEDEDTGSDTNIQMNATLPSTLGVISKQHDIPVIHLSTDYVFQGDASERGYTENMKTNPLNEYGRVKLMGETALTNISKRHYIIRTSWIYSENRNNFVKHWFNNADSELNGADVVMDQIGRPTSAIELAEVILKMAYDTGENYGIYHYGGSDVMSWAEFAETIFKKMNSNRKVNHIASDLWYSPAVRPKNNNLNIDKIKETFNLKPLSTNLYLTEVIRRLQTDNEKV
tara:strand:- start:1571 stop:2470 length:900 start_codon:yes stop_codon:yes gene_type:complete